MRGKSPQTWGHERRSRRDEWILNLGSKGNGITLKTCAFVPSKHCAIFVQHGLVMKNIELIFTSSFNWTRSFSGSFHFLCRTVVCWRLFCCGLSSSSIYENVIRRKREYYNCSLKIKWLYVCSDLMVYSWNPDWNNPIQTLFFFFCQPKSRVIPHKTHNDNNGKLKKSGIVNRSWYGLQLSSYTRIWTVTKQWRKKINNGTHCDVMQLRQAKEKKCFSCLPDTFGMSGLQGFQKLTFQWLKTSSACIIKGQQYIKSVFQKWITPESKSIFHALDIPFFNLFF